MPAIIGFSFSIAVLLIISMVKYPDSTFPITKTWLFSRPLKIRSDNREIWPDVVDDLSSAIRAGLSLPQAMLLLAESGPTAIRSSFKQAMQRYQVTGDFVGALELLGAINQDPICDKFVSALQIAYEVGGTDLGYLLRTLSEVIREDNKLRGEIDARQSWTINGARLAIAAPWVTVLILSTRESALSIYLSGPGIQLLIFCAVISLIAYLAMTKIGKLPEVKRIKL